MTEMLKHVIKIKTEELITIDGEVLNYEAEKKIDILKKLLEKYFTLCPFQFGTK